MALAESLLRKVHKLGLVPRIVRALPRVALLLALSSLVWLLVLPMEGQYRNTYILENALMPGQVTSYFRESEWNIVRGYRSEVSKWDFSAMAESNPTLELWMQELGLEVSHHVDGSVSTMYAVMHAPRGDNTEAMVLVVPYFSIDGQDNVGAFALAPALTRYFSRMSIWQKNIILVFPRDTYALRRWVEAYHTQLDDTAGSIEAAIVIEYALKSDSFHHMDIEYDGLNGELPNLDLINCVTTVARNERISVGIQGILDNNGYNDRLRTLARGIVGLATAGTHPGPGCEAFSGWQIQALTLRAVGTGGPDITQFGRIVDLTFRAVNNLLEKFHQSFFFYFMLAPPHFVSIGTYLPAAVLLAAAYAVLALYSVVLKPGNYIQNSGSVLAIFTAIELVCLGGAFTANTISSGNIVVGSITLTVTIALLTIPKRRVLLLPLQLRLLVAFALYFVAMLITSLLIVHFALAFVIGLGAWPLTFIPLLDQTMRLRVRRALFLAVSSPVTAIPVFAYFWSGPDLIIPTVRGLLTAWPEMQCWTWFVVALGWLPAWIAVAVACMAGDFGDELKSKQE